MQKHPMYSVKQAAAALGCDERWVREQLNQGQLKGEKQSIGLKEKWFVYSGEVERVLARKASHTQPTQTAPQQFFGVEEQDTEPIDAEVESTTAGSTDNQSIGELVKIIANQFAEKLDEQKSLTFQLQRELEEKDRQLKLLPDLQKKMEEANLKQFELDALKKQLEDVQALKDKAQAEADKVQQIEESVLPELRKQLEAERDAKIEALSTLNEQVRLLEEKQQIAERDLNEERIRKNLELEKLQAKVATIDEYIQSAEEAARRIEELERVTLDKQKDNEEQARILDELKQAKEEKDAQVADMEAHVQELTKKLEKASKGFWRRFFFGSNA